MRYDILWTDEAKETFDIIIQFLELQWSEQIASKFVLTVNHKINLLSIYPNLYQSSVTENVRRVVISKHNSMFYEISLNRIIILFFIDNRQEPLL